MACEGAHRYRRRLRPVHLGQELAIGLRCQMNMVEEDRCRRRSDPSIVQEALDPLPFCRSVGIIALRRAGLIS